MELFDRPELVSLILARVDKMCKSEPVGSRGYAVAINCLMWLFAAGDLPFR